MLQKCVVSHLVPVLKVNSTKMGQVWAERTVAVHKWLLRVLYHSVSFIIQLCRKYYLEDDQSDYKVHGTQMI